MALLTSTDRRRHSREGLMAQLEDITYTALRKCYANASEQINSAPGIYEMETAGTDSR